MSKKKISDISKNDEQKKKKLNFFKKLPKTQYIFRFWLPV